MTAFLKDKFIIPDEVPDDIQRNIIGLYHKLQSILGKNTAKDTILPGVKSKETLLPLWQYTYWIPMYVTHEDHHHSIRGGYVYAELIGPNGSLGIKTINGWPFGGEIGFAVQLANTIYPIHFHQTPELYISLNKNVTGGRILISDFIRSSYLRSLPYHPLRRNGIQYIDDGQYHAFTTRSNPLIFSWARWGLDSHTGNNGDTTYWLTSKRIR